MISVLRRYFSQHWLPVTISQQYWTDRATLQVRANQNFSQIVLLPIKEIINCICRL